MTRPFVTLMCGVALFTANAFAGLIVSPGGTILFDSASDHDDESSNGRSLGFTGLFFGGSHTTVDISTNGFGSFSGNATFSNDALPTATARIAPLWDDLFIYSGTGQSIKENVNAGVYYSATWDISHFDNSSLHYDFQFVWFGASTTIGGFNFQANDIAFAYNGLSASGDGSATVGLDFGNSSVFAPAPGTADGIISDNSTLPTGNNFILFRWNGESYNASTQSIVPTEGVPEPGAWQLVAAGIAILGARLFRRKA